MRRAGRPTWSISVLVGAPDVNSHIAFAARPWELNKTESIDVMDALGCAIAHRYPRPRSDAHFAAHQRRHQRGVDSDKTRHVVDGLRTQRLDQPYVRENGISSRPAT